MIASGVESDAVSHAFAVRAAECPMPEEIKIGL
jgi:hypothetical protein